MKRKTLTLKRAIGAIESRQADVLRRGHESVEEARKLLTAIESCLDKSKMFPIYDLSDFQASARVLGLLASQHVMLEKLKTDLDR